MSKSRLLIVEDDQDLRDSLVLLLEDHYEVSAEASGMGALKAALSLPPQVILLDLKMPDLDGFQTCKLLRSDKDLQHIPILVVSGQNNSADRTRAFQVGADDFIAKPFTGEELLARIRRKLEATPAPSLKPNSKTSLAETRNIDHLSNLKFDMKNQTFSIDERTIHLSALEFRLLRLLTSNEGNLVSRERIIEEIWEGQPVSSRVIDPHIVSIRDKIKGSGYSISSIYGKGYVLKPLV